MKEPYEEEQVIPRSVLKGVKQMTQVLERWEDNFLSNDEVVRQISHLLATTSFNMMTKNVNFGPV